MATAAPEDTAIGIDLGTTYSCVAVFKNDKVKIIANDNGNRITPSMVSFTEYGYLVGDEAKNRLTLDPQNTVYESKRLIGRASDDPIVQKDKAYWPFTVVDVDGKPMIQVQTSGETKEFSAERISSLVLSKMKETAEAYLEQVVKKAVITVPAYFNDSQRQATIDAARLANLEVLRIINEPTAAAMAYGLQKNVDEEQHVLVFDLGGGTFDVSLLRIDDGVIQVKGTGGNTHLGGADFDNKLVDRCINFFNNKEEVNSDVTTDSTKREYHRLRKACELAKCQISTHQEETVFVEMFHENINLNYEVTRVEFEGMIDELLEETMTHVNQTLTDEGIGPEKIDKVVLIGGSTRIPKLRQKLAQRFGKQKICTSINPDEAVAYGAAIQAAILSGHESDMLSDVVLVDVTPLSIGINIKGDIMLTIVKRNALIPCRYSEEVTTVHDKQTSIQVSVYQGERPLTKDNHYLGEFYLRDIPPQPPGVPKIDITCNVDADGCLSISALDKSNKDNISSVQIEPNKARCCDKDIQRILQDASENLSEDTREKQRITARNKLDELVVWIIYILKNHSEKLEISPNTNQKLFMKAKENDEWLKKNLYNNEEEYSERLLELQTECASINQDYRNPGKLPNLTAKVVPGYGVLCYSDESDYDDVPDVD